MSVMSCHRCNCENIMCDTYIKNVGYICTECQKEFKGFLKHRGIVANTEGQILTALKSFMITEKGNYVDDQISVKDFFLKHTC